MRDFLASFFGNRILGTFADISEVTSSKACIRRSMCELVMPHKATKSASGDDNATTVS